MVATARMSMLQAVMVPPAMQPPAIPIVIRTSAPRRRSRTDLENITGAVAALMMFAALAFAAGCFFKESWKDLPKKSSFTRTDTRLSAVTLRKKPPFPSGAGTSANTSTFRKTPTTGKPQPKLQPPPVSVPDMTTAREHLTKALTLARNESFTEARRLARRAAKAMPKEAEGLSLMIDYVENYSTLADQARKSLNGSSEVDLGEPWGKAPFVSQDNGSITFFVKGKHEQFTIERFNKLEGVRYRVTRDYLDNAHNPHNNLILGSYLFLLHLNDKGECDEKNYRREAECRLRKAIASGNAEAAGDGTLMMKMLTFGGPN